MVVFSQRGLLLRRLGGLSLRWVACGFATAMGDNTLFSVGV